MTFGLENGIFLQFSYNFDKDSTGTARKVIKKHCI